MSWVCTNYIDGEAALVPKRVDEGVIHVSPLLHLVGEFIGPAYRHLINTRVYGWQTKKPLLWRVGDVARDNDIHKFAALFDVKWRCNNCIASDLCYHRLLVRGATAAQFDDMCQSTCLVGEPWSFPLAAIATNRLDLLQRARVFPTVDKVAQLDSEAALTASFPHLPASAAFEWIQAIHCAIRDQSLDVATWLIWHAPLSVHSEHRAGKRKAAVESHYQRCCVYVDWSIARHHADMPHMLYGLLERFNRQEEQSNKRQKSDALS